MSYHFFFSLIERCCPFCKHQGDEFQQEGIFRCADCSVIICWKGAARFVSYHGISFVIRPIANEIDVYLDVMQLKPSFSIKGAALSMEDIKRAEKLKLL